MRILSKYFWFDLHQRVKDFLWPKNKWLTKIIPNHWIDKDGLLEEIIAASLIHFVEEEDGLNKCDWTASKEHWAAYNKLTEAYHWFKWRKRAKENNWLAMIPETDLLKELSKDEKEIFRIAHDTELTKQALDNFHILNVIKYRNHLWT